MIYVTAPTAVHLYLYEVTKTLTGVTVYRTAEELAKSL